MKNNQLTIIESAVLKLIPIGSQRKISIAEIGILVDLDQRSVFEIVNKLRRKGVPICAKRNGLKTNRGYFIATNDAERVDGIASYKSQVQDMQFLIEQIEKADLQRWPELLNVGGGDA